MSDLASQITAYLFNGGMFNPELANHIAVRDLLIECRDALEESQKDAKRYQWMRERFLGADFDWGESGECVLLISVPDEISVYGDLTLTIDSIMKDKQ